MSVRERERETDVPVYCVPREVLEEAIKKNRRATDFVYSLEDDSPYLRFLRAVKEATKGRRK